MRNLIYIIIVAGFVAGAVMDAAARDFKSAAVAGLFALANATIFFWRET